MSLAIAGNNLGITSSLPPGAFALPQNHADEHERANGRLYSEVQFALPKELNEDERRETTSSFAERLMGGERLPYTLAIHRGGTNGENPHAHLMFSERGNDGIERSGEQWFKRYNAKAPEKGGARKSRSAKAGDWLDKTRQAWEQTANRALERAGRTFTGTSSSLNLFSYSKIKPRFRGSTLRDCRTLAER